MDHRICIPVRNDDVQFEDTGSLVLVVEPWANEFVLQPGEECEVVITNPSQQPKFKVEYAVGRLVFTVEVEGSLYELWQNGKRID